MIFSCSAPYSKSLLAVVSVFGESGCVRNSVSVYRHARRAVAIVSVMVIPLVVRKVSTTCARVLCVSLEMV